MALGNLITLLLSLVNQLGYLGILIGMTIESSFFPFPSEIILIPAGALIAQGKMSFLPVFFAGVLGSILGAWINYFIAFVFGRKTIDIFIEKYGRFLFVTQKSLKKSDKYFEEHGEITTFVGRLIFVVRQLISLPAGFAKMNPLKFTLYTALGAGIWTLVLIALGYFFGSTADSMTKLIAGVLLAISLIIGLVYYLRTRPRKLKKQNKN